MATDLHAMIQTARIPPGEVSAKSRQIYHHMLLESEYLDRGNFTAVHTADLAILFDLYDQAFFDGKCRKLLGTRRLQFHLSRRMTRAGARTTHHVFRQGNGQIEHEYFEIAVSSHLLFQSFELPGRSITVCGHTCQDRLEALQRLFEHECVHLVEMLLWHESSCAGERFRSIASRFFSHSDHTHALVTSHERAATKFGIRIGDRVSFEFESIPYAGVVNRITKRATVLVENPGGRRYTDGKRYSKFYVPLEMLERVGG